MGSSDKTSIDNSSNRISNSLSDSQKPESNTSTISSISEFLKCIEEIIEKYDVVQKSKILFRGQESAKWPVETSAYRRLKNAAGNEQISEEYEMYYNFGLIQEFKLRDFHSSNSSEIMKLDLGILAQLQHNGAATSLIDFSDNPLIALWFACKESSEADNNGKIFILPTGDETRFEEIDNFEQIKNYEVKVPEKIEATKVNGILNNKKFVYWKPAHLNNRITAQQSYFLIGKRAPPPMQEIIIAGDYKNKILEELLLIYGIDGTTLLPDLVGFAQTNSFRSPYGKEEEQLKRKSIIRIHDKIIARNPKDVKAYNNRGLVKYNFNDFQGALNDFTEGIQIDPNNADAYKNRGYIKNVLEDYKGALDDCNKSIEIDPNNANTYNSRGVAKYNLKDYKGAIDNYSKAIEIEATDATTYNNRGITKYKLKDYKDALDDYNKAIDMKPGSASFLYNRGLVKYSLQDYTGSIDDYNKAIGIDPNYVEAYNYRGLIKNELKDHKGAIDDYNKVIDIEPTNAYVYNSRGYAKNELNDYKGALDDYQIALKYSKDKKFTEHMIKVITNTEEKLKESQDELPEDNK